MADEEPTTPKQAFIRRALELAQEDPEKFRAEVAALGKKLGLTAEEVYRRLQADPELARVLGRDALNRAMSRGAEMLRKKLGI